MKLVELFSILYLIPVSLTLSRSKLEERGVYRSPTVYRRSITESADEPPEEEGSQKDNEMTVEGNEIPSYFESEKPESLIGWLPSPKNGSDIETEIPVENNLVKDGFCEHTLNYGIRCGKRMDQCKGDLSCPGVTKCCLVSDCGLMCVKPKAKLKHPIIQKKKLNKEDLKKDVVTTAEGLKLEDITKLPETGNITISSPTGIVHHPDTDAAEASIPSITTRLSSPDVTTEIPDAISSNGLDTEGDNSTILPDGDDVTILPEEDVSTESTVS